MPQCNLNDLGIYEKSAMLDKVIPQVEKKFLNNYQYLRNLSINNINVSDILSSTTYTIENRDLLKFEIFTDHNCHIETLNLSLTAIDKISKTLTDCSNLSYNELVCRLSVSVELIDITLKNVIQAHSDFNIPTNVTYPSGFNFHKLKIHLLSIFKAVGIALKTQDHVMLSDLLEYELKDNITQWKIYVIPSIIHSVVK
jgi:hypothetical protein